MKTLIEKIRVLGAAAKTLIAALEKLRKPFPGSGEYWQRRYRSGRTSGPGSYNRLAVFKAETLNKFVTNYAIETVVEFGCGDGNQLQLANYPAYLGFDVSSDAVSRCRTIFAGDKTKKFELMSEYSNETADVSLSLDVIFHLIEDDVFDQYMRILFESVKKFVVIYSSNTNDNRGNKAVHVRHRKFSDWIEKYQSQWVLLAHIPNRFPYSGNIRTGSFSDFYIYQKTSSRDN